MPTILSRLKCSCRRVVSLLCSPTKERIGFRDPRPVLRKFYTKSEFVPDSFLYRKCVEEARIRFQSIFPVLHPYHFNDRLEDIAKDTSPGIHYKAKGYKTKKECLDEPKIRNELRFLCHQIKTGSNYVIPHKFPSQVCVADAKSDNGIIKARVVWVYPLAVTACENMFFAAIKDNLPEDWVYKPETHHHSFCGRNSGAFDFKNFDSTVSARLIKDSFDILRELFDFSEYEGGAKPYKYHSLETLWNWLYSYFVNTPHCIAGDDTIRYKYKGVPSGSMFTNIIDTIASHICATYIHRRSYCGASILSYGDDVIFKNCGCRAEYAETHAVELSVVVKVEKPNEHGCLTYCKAECHLGVPFHPGTWYRNILNCTTFKHETAECLMYTKPTRLQLKELKSVRHTISPTGPSRWLAKWKEKFTEYIGTESKIEVTDL